LDFLKLEKARNGAQYILLIVDHFTRYTQGYATTNKSALTAAKRIFEDYIPKLGIPLRIMHDQGKEFDNRLWKELEKFCGITASRTSPYHPQCNGACERMNSTILSMLRCLPESDKHKWNEKVNFLLFCYNITKHSTTQESPYYLMFGRQPTIPLDFILHGEMKPQQEIGIYQEYLEDFEKRMTETYQLVREKCDKSKDKAEERWGKKLLTKRLKVGDKVLVQNKRETGGPGKIRSAWEQKVYVIIEELRANTLYKVKGLNPNDKDPTSKFTPKLQFDGRTGN